MPSDTEREAEAEWAAKEVAEVIYADALRENRHDLTRGALEIRLKQSVMAVLTLLQVGVVLKLLLLKSLSHTSV